MRKLLLVAGPSGSGKSRLARRAGSRVGMVSLDDFYRDYDYPGMPKTLGITDWDKVESWDLDTALVTLRQLLAEGIAEVPLYDISQSKRIGMRTMNVRDARVIIAEGIFAPDTYVAAREAGLPCEAIWLDRRRIGNFSRRLTRDLREHRKPPRILVRRGLALYRKEPELRVAALNAGFTPHSMRSATRRLHTLTETSP